jgi:hypothetical protein
LHDALEDKCHFCSYLLSALIRLVLAAARRSLVTAKEAIGCWCRKS